MPAGDPQIGEVWTTRNVVTGDTMRGVVGELASNVTTMISFTGHRLRMPPARMLTSWTYAEPGPLNHRPCASGTNCESNGIFRIARPEGGPVFWCTRHVPAGVVSTLANDTEDPWGLPPGALTSIGSMTIRTGLDRRVTREPPRIVAGSSGTITTSNHGGPRACPRCQSDLIVSRLVILDGRSSTITTEPFDHYHCNGCNANMAVSREYLPGEIRQFENDFQHMLQRQSGSLYLSPEAIRRDACGVQEEDGTYVFSHQPLDWLEGLSALIILASDPQTRAMPRDHIDPNLPPLLRTLPEVGSQWIDEAGRIVSVVSLTPNSDGVHIRRERSTSNILVLLTDFHILHKLYAREVSTAPAPDIELRVGDEWQNISGLFERVFTLDQIHPSNKYVVMLDRATGTRSTVIVETMTPAQWTRVHRTSTYDRLIGEDDF